MAGVVVIAFRTAAPQTGFTALVLGSDGQEATDRITEVNHDGLVVAGAHLPDRIEPRVVGLDVAAVAILEFEPQIFPNLQSLSSRAKAALQLRGGFFGPARIVDSFPVDPCEFNDAVAVGLTHLHVLVEGFS